MLSYNCVTVTLRSCFEAINVFENTILWILRFVLTLLLLNTTCSVLANSGDPDQLASQNPGSSNLTGWKLEVGVASKFIQHEKG